MYNCKTWFTNDVLRDRSTLNILRRVYNQLYNLKHFYIYTKRNYVKFSSLDYFQHNEDWSLLGYLEHRKAQKDFKSNKADEHFFYVRNLEYLANEHENEEYREKAKRYLNELM
jgi:hypothetical protein